MIYQYLVIGIYQDNGQRFATTVEAESPKAAEEAAIEEADSGLTVAGVVQLVNGEMEVVA